ncbi:MAG: hypothetical protein ACYC11_05420 [Bellilinea sp.]
MRRPQPNLQLTCHREGAIFATVAIRGGLAQIATPLRGSKGQSPGGSQGQGWF